MHLLLNFTHEKKFVPLFKFRIPVSRWWLHCGMNGHDSRKIDSPFVPRSTFFALSIVENSIESPSSFRDNRVSTIASNAVVGAKSVMSTDVIAPSPSLFSTRKTDRSLFQYESKTDCGYQRQEPEWNYHNKGLRPGRDDGIWTTASARIRKVNELSYQTQKIAYRSLVPRVPFDFPTDNVGPR